MSSSVIINSNINNINKEKKNSINEFSNNFNKCFNKLKYSKAISDNNKENNSSKNENNKNNTNQKNTLMEFEIIMNDSKEKALQSKQKNKVNKAKTIDNKTKNNKNKKNINEAKKSNTVQIIPKQQENKNNIKKNNTIQSIPNKPKSLNNKNSFNTQSQKTLIIKSQLYQNKYKSRQPKNYKRLNKNLSRNISEKNIIKNFLENVKTYQIKKEENLKNKRDESLAKEDSQIKSCPDISKNSILLCKNLTRPPLYQKPPLDDEKKLAGFFKSFYSKNFEDNKNNTFNVKSPLNNKAIEKRYQKFYTNNITWKKRIDEINDDKRNNKKKIYEESIDSCSFKPSLDKNSLNIVDKLNRNKSFNYTDNNIYDLENDKELIDRLKTKLKPIIINCYMNSSNKPYINKKSALLNKTFSYNDIRKKIYHNYNFKTKKNENKNYKIDYKLSEKKFKCIKKEEKKETINKSKKDNSNKKGKDFYLLLKIKEVRKEKEEKKRELYKLNIRPGTAWNLESINNIIPRQKCNHIIEGLL